MKSKMTIQLTDEQSGPFPVSTESLWFDLIEDYYEVRSIPFFIDGLSFSDLVSLKKLTDDVYEIDSIIKYSKNSTVWIYICDESIKDKLIDDISLIGCGVEGEPIEGYFAINVPEKIDIEKLYELIDDFEEQGKLKIDYPSIRHPD